ncbi:hypothetical protein [Neisseria dumasiana]|uniref:hypothetical protein n=1 Tax=Neisseria dumasiana TaxID=1931275 RepID=UPI000A18D08E|nr:hypothetical protein [Neisseria dumasiana]OSI14975.1 hypothetical protein BV914_08805 [Neisseria dumasiana]
MNQNQTQQAAAPQSKQNPLFNLQHDGIGTFLAIASNQISQWQRDGQLSEADTVVLQEQINCTLLYMGKTVSDLAACNMDYTNQDDNTLSAALSITGQIMQEMAGISYTLEHNRATLRRDAENAAKQAAQKPSSEEWPNC